MSANTTGVWWMTVSSTTLLQVVNLNIGCISNCFGLLCEVMGPNLRQIQISLHLPFCDRSSYNHLVIVAHFDHCAIVHS